MSEKWNRWDSLGGKGSREIITEDESSTLDESTYLVTVS